MQAYLLNVETGNGWFEAALYFPGKAVIIPPTQKVAPATGHEAGIQAEFERLSLVKFFSASKLRLALAHDMVFGGPLADSCYSFFFNGPREIPDELVGKVEALCQEYNSLEGRSVPPDLRQRIGSTSSELLGLMNLDDWKNL